VQRYSRRLAQQDAAGRREPASTIRARLLLTTEYWSESPYSVSVCMTALLAIAEEGSDIVLSEELADTRCLGRRTRAGAIQREHNGMLYDWTLSHPVLRACNDIPRLQDLNSQVIARL
jgi:hypothetical protein